jgi:uncharacterized protein (TIGR03083 family)
MGTLCRAGPNGSAVVVTYLESYDGVRRRLEPVLSAADPQQRVPACPGWSVGDVLAHLVGLCEDWVDGRFDGYASEPWTAAHLQRRRGDTSASLLNRWRATMTAFAMVDQSPLGASPARWAFGDAVIHEGDIRGATTGDRVPATAVELALQDSLARWYQVLRGAGLKVVRVVLPDGRALWTGSPDDRRAVEVEVEVELYEAFRGLVGRRSAAQVAEWSWSDDPGPYLAAGLPYPFRWAADPIED